MDRRKFSRNILLSGLVIPALNRNLVTESIESGIYLEDARKLPVREFDVVVAGGGTAGVVAAMAAARQGAKTALIEAKGYPGGTFVEGGTALHMGIFLHTQEQISLSLTITRYVTAWAWVMSILKNCMTI